jgi:hypothetical protein
MALSHPGSAAGEAAETGTSRSREPLVPRPGTSDETLLDAIRRGLHPGDPIARLLARWPRPAARAVEVPPGRRAGWLPGPA